MSAVSNADVSCHRSLSWSPPDWKPTDSLTHRCMDGTNHSAATGRSERVFTRSQVGAKWPRSSLDRIAYQISGTGELRRANTSDRTASAFQPHGRVWNNPFVTKLMAPATVAGYLYCSVIGQRNQWGQWVQDQHRHCSSANAPPSESCSSWRVSIGPCTFASGVPTCSC